MRGRKINYKLIVILLILSLILIPTALAHVPKTSQGNTSLDTAKHVHDPTKSWVIYSELKKEEEAHYYEIKLEEGERLKCSILLPEENDFLPDLIIMGPQFSNSSDIPGHLEVPDDYGYKVIEGEKGEREYEPFTPGSYYYPVEYDEEVNQSTIYYVVVTEENSSGKYGLAVGYEERYGMIEWIRVPWDVVTIHRWEGQSIWLIFSPMLITFLSGAIYFIWSKQNLAPTPNYLGGWFTSIAGLSYIGTGGMMLLQMIISSMKASPGPLIIVTIIFTTIPIVLGFFTFFFGIKMELPISLGERVKLIVLSIVAIIAWAGLIIGPLLALIGAVLPLKNKKG
ncbi:MAG: hypothetical protein ACOC5D_02125 [Thermoplasmatota archaeon]